jgi:hypothetical protein
MNCVIERIQKEQHCLTFKPSFIGNLVCANPFEELTFLHSMRVVEYRGVFQEMLSRQLAQIINTVSE